jgi:hypothetical protein
MQALHSQESSEALLCLEYLPLIFTCSSTNPWGDGTGSWSDGQGRVLVNGVSPLIGEAWGCLLALCTIWEHSEKVLSMSSGLLSDSKSAVALLLDFPASRTGRNKCLLLISHPVYAFCYNNPTNLKPALMITQCFLCQVRLWNQIDRWYIDR